VDSWQGEADWVDRWTEQWSDRGHHPSAPSQWTRAWSRCHWSQGLACIQRVYINTLMFMWMANMARNHYRTLAGLPSMCN